MTDMDSIVTVSLILAAWVLAIAITYAIVIPWLSRRPADEPFTGLLWWIVRIFTHLMHDVRFEGKTLTEEPIDERGLIVVSNHTGAVDPLLIQAGCPFVIRWMMASEMMSPALDWLWRHQRLIAVDRNGNDTGPLREAIRHVRAGGVLGIFPEGRIVTPPRRVWPFAPGVGLIVARNGAPVLLVWVSGTPDTNRMSASLLTRSHAKVVYIERLEFGKTRDVSAITETLRRKLSEASGWPMVDEVTPKREASLDPFAA